MRDLGVVVAVDSTFTYGYAIVKSEDRVNHRVAFSELKRDDVEFPAAVQPYRTQVERVAYDVWDEADKPCRIGYFSLLSREGGTHVVAETRCPNRRISVDFVRSAYARN